MDEQNEKVDDNTKRLREICKERFQILEKVSQDTDCGSDLW